MPAAKALGVGVMRDFRAKNICAEKIKKAKIFSLLFNTVNKRSSLYLSREGKDSFYNSYMTKGKINSHAEILVRYL